MAYGPLGKCSIAYVFCGIGIPLTYRLRPALIALFIADQLMGLESHQLICYEQTDRADQSDQCYAQLVSLLLISHHSISIIGIAYAAVCDQQGGISKTLVLRRDSNQGKVGG